jgi:hypothetical protein
MMAMCIGSDIRNAADAVCCCVCAEQQYMQLMPIGAKLRIKAGRLSLKNRVIGEIINHFTTRVMVMWGHNGAEPPSTRALLNGAAPQSTNFMALPSALLEMYDIELPKGGR